MNKPCPFCKGAGKIIDKFTGIVLNPTCPICEGVGRLNDGEQPPQLRELIRVEREKRAEEQVKFNALYNLTIVKEGPRNETPFKAVWRLHDEPVLSAGKKGSKQKKVKDSG